MLEFETSVDGKYVNGVDIIRCDATGRIVEFRVMMRPLQGTHAVPSTWADVWPPAADGDAGCRNDEGPAVSDRGASCALRVS